MPRAAKPRGRLGLPGMVIPIPTGLARVRHLLPALLEEAAGMAVLALALEAAVAAGVGTAEVVVARAAVAVLPEAAVAEVVVAPAAQPALAAPVERTAANL